MTDNLNESKLKTILVNLERKFVENQKLRIKYSDDPAKFASSETELFAALDELQGVATQPELYHVLIAKNTPKTLMSLITHDNTDISAKVIGGIQEFTDIDSESEQKHVELMIDALDKENFVDVIVSNLTRLDEKNREEAQTINNSVAILDNLVDYDSKFATKGGKFLIKWIVEKLKNSSEFTAIKLAITELLSILLMSAPENRTYFSQVCGVDVLLRQVAFYRRLAPVTGEEHEFLEQVINCLCTSILDCDENRESFYKEEGVDLVELILREKRSAVKESNIKFSMLRLFNHVLTTDKNNDPTVTKCCERFVQVLGLRVLFPIFNNPKIVLNEKVKRRDYQKTLDETEEHTTAIILALLKYCQDTDLIQRVLVKFAEANFEKLDRLLALHEKYYRIVSNQHINEEADVNDSDDSEEAGKGSAHFTLRTIDYIILLTCYLSDRFETYDPNSGETFTNRVGKVLACKPDLRDQIVMEVKRHIEEVASSLEERNSLELLLKFFEQVSSSLMARYLAKFELQRDQK